ncbi:hypothetical protein [Streptomyces sp. NPDC003863]
MADVRTGEPADVCLQLLHDELVGVPLRDEAGELGRPHGVLRERVSTDVSAFGRQHRRHDLDLGGVDPLPLPLADGHGLVEHGDIDTEDLRQVLPGVGNGNPRFALVSPNLFAGLRGAPLQGVVLVGDLLLAPAARGTQPDEQGADPGVAHAVPQEHVTSGPHSGPRLGPRAGSRPK